MWAGPATDRQSQPAQVRPRARQGQGTQAQDAWPGLHGHADRRQEHVQDQRKERKW